MMMEERIFNDITQTIGKTPLVRLKKIAAECCANVIAKVEFFNPGGSIKDRIGLSMIKAAEKQNLITKNSIIIEPTSGNTGIALAMVCAAKGYKLMLTMPESMSLERIKILKAFGVDVVLTPADEGMRGAIKKAEELAATYPESFIPQQFNNLANPEAHKTTTAIEIWEDIAGKIDVFVAGVGTGGTITGIGEYLKSKKKEVKIIAVEPRDSNVLSGGQPSNHLIQGIGPGFIPEVMNISIVDEIITISNQKALNTAHKLAQTEGIFCGISSGAAVAAALNVAKREEFDNKNIVVLLPDTGERYIMMDMFMA